MKKRLYKDKSNSKICGVCSGVADYFDIDVSVVRILTFFAIWAWGVGLAVYIVAAVILPDKSEVDRNNTFEGEYREKKQESSSKSKSLFDE